MTDGINIGEIGKNLKELPAEIQKYLSGLDFPADKNKIMEVAKRNNAPEIVLKLIEKLPDGQFNGLQDVTKAYDNLKNVL